MNKRQKKKQLTMRRKKRMKIINRAIQKGYRNKPTILIMIRFLSPSMRTKKTMKPVLDDNYILGGFDMNDDLIRYDVALLDVVASERDDQDNLVWDTPFNILVMYDKETQQYRAIDYHDMMHGTKIPEYIFDDAPESGKYDSIFAVIKCIVSSLAYDKEHITFRKFGVVYLRPRCSYYIHGNDRMKFIDICHNIDEDQKDYEDGIGR